MTDFEKRINHWVSSLRIRVEQRLLASNVIELSKTECEMAGGISRSNYGHLLWVTQFPTEVSPLALQTCAVKLFCILLIDIMSMSENVWRSKSAMRLFGKPSNSSMWDSASSPGIFEGFQVDGAMEPVIFWKNLETLINKLRPKIKRVFEEREELLTEQEARDYFLPIGRLEGKVFVSNEKSQNQFVVQELVPKFRESAVKCFHYKREDAITTGARWFAEITTEIKNSSIFVALIDSHYQNSRYCMEELRVALEESRKGRIKIHAYVVEEGVSPPDPLSILQVPHIQDLQDNKKADLVIRDAIRFLETGQCVRLREGDESWLEDLLARLPEFSLPSDRRHLLREAGLP